MDGRMISWFKKNDLAALLLISIFMNGFETGGYQAVLLSIGQTYQLDERGQGILAAVELFATMIAPIIFGTIADKVGKRIMLILSTLERVISGTVMFLAFNSIIFAVGIALLGCATSIIQYVAIAEMDDAYPVTRHHRMGFIAATYALGAVVAPLIVGATIHGVFGWRAFFLVDCVISAIMAFLLWKCSFAVREEVLDDGMQEELADATRPVHGETSKIYYFGVALLCIIMFVYVGVENGVGFFLNGFMYSTMDSEKGYLALSLFWFAMIPARILCGIFAKYRETLLCLASIGATAFLLVLSMVKSENVTFLVVFILGFFCGAVYPNVLTYAADFAGGRTATVIAAITVATGVGGTLVSGVFGFLENMLGYSASFVVLMAFMAIDIVISIWVVKIGRRVVQ